MSTLPAPHPRVLHLVIAPSPELMAAVAAITRTLADIGIGQVVMTGRAEGEWMPAPTDDEYIRHVGLELPAQASFRTLTHTLRDALVRELVEGDLTAIHIHGATSALAARAALLGLRTRPASFYSPHGLPELSAKWAPARWRLHAQEWLGGRIECALVGNHPAEARQLQAWGRRDAQVVEDGVQHSFFELPRRETQVPLVLAAGRVCAATAPDRFAALAARFHIAELPARFAWIGDGDAGLKGHLQAAGVKLYAYADENERLALYSEASVFVQASRAGDATLPILQGLAAGVPCVVTDVAGHRDVVRTGITGYVAATPDDLVIAVRRLLEDHVLRRRFGQMARADAADRFGMDSLRHRLCRLYGLPDRAAPAGLRPRTARTGRLLPFRAPGSVPPEAANG